MELACVDLVGRAFRVSASWLLALGRPVFRSSSLMAFRSSEFQVKIPALDLCAKQPSSGPVELACVNLVGRGLRVSASLLIALGRSVFRSRRTWSSGGARLALPGPAK